MTEIERVQRFIEGTTIECAPSLREVGLEYVKAYMAELGAWAIERDFAASINARGGVLSAEPPSRPRPEPPPPPPGVTVTWGTWG